MIAGHGDYHPAFGRSFSDTVDLTLDSPSSMLSGEAFLERVFTAYRSATSPAGPNVWNTPLLIGWDEPDGTYDHVRDPDTWASVTVLPVPEWTMGPEVVGRGLSTLGKGASGPARTVSAAVRLSGAKPSASRATGGRGPVTLPRDVAPF